MRSFNKFLENQQVQNKIYQAAELMVEKNVNPDLFITHYYEQNHPEIAHLINEDFWTGAKQFGQHALQGLKNASGAFMNNAFGPQTKFDSAVKSLTQLTQQLQSDQSLKQWLASNPGNQLLSQVNGMIQQLGQMKGQVPQNVAKPGQNQWQAQNPNPQPPAPPTQQQPQQTQYDPNYQPSLNWRPTK